MLYYFLTKFCIRSYKCTLHVDNIVVFFFTKDLKLFKKKDMGWQEVNIRKKMGDIERLRMIMIKNERDA